MKATARLLLAFAMFLVVVITTLPLIVLEWLAKPLRWLNARALALIAEIHSREAGS